MPVDHPAYTADPDLLQTPDDLVANFSTSVADSNPYASRDDEHEAGSANTVVVGDVLMVSDLTMYSNSDVLPQTIVPCNSTTLSAPVLDKCTYNAALYYAEMCRVSNNLDVDPGHEYHHIIPFVARDHDRCDTYVDGNEIKSYHFDMLIFRQSCRDLLEE